MLWLFILLGILTVFYILYLNGKRPKVKFPSLLFGIPKGHSPLYYFSHSVFLFRLLALSFLILVLARPQSSKSWKDVATEGIDIVISMDVSGSMLAQDFKPDRLEAAKNTAIDFIQQRPNDRIGLVVYEGESFTQCPLTTDHRVLINLFQQVESGMIKGGTAIGSGLANAVSRLRSSDAKSKVVILLSDGENNAGNIAPMTAAEIAKSYGIRVYTIGVGARGQALAPVAMYPNGKYKYDYVDVNIDEELLTEIATLTGGKYFRATENESLEETLREIDLMEKTKIQVTEHSKKSERFYPFAMLAVAFLGIEFFLKNTLFNGAP